MIKLMKPGGAKNQVELKREWHPIGRVFVGLALILVPWTVYLGFALPMRHLSAHWDISWVGLDAAEAAALFATGWLAYRHSRWTATVAPIAGTLLLVDAWFDVLSARASGKFYEALALALVIELPLAIISFYMAELSMRERRQK
jgi:hypothetical protein